MPCTDCQAAREAPGRTLFNPLCVWCGARILRMIDKQPIEPLAKRDRKRASLTDWLTFGHSEQEIRRLYALGSPALEPPPETAVRAPRTKAKPA